MTSRGMRVRSIAAAVGAKEARRPAAPRTTVATTEAPTAAETERRLFFEAIGHTDASHRVGAATAYPWPAEHNRAGRDVGDHCGWIWCAEKDASAARWRNLSAALALLSDGDGPKIDPWSEEVAWIAQRHRGAESWSTEREGFEALQRALEGITTHLGSKGEELRSKWASELFPYLGVAREKMPPRKPGVAGRNRKVPDWVALEQAEKFGMSTDPARLAEIVAAILVLTGRVLAPVASVSKALKQLNSNRRTKLTPER